MNDFAILGAGALGTVIGAKLSLAGFKVQLIARNQEHIKNINRNGLVFIENGVRKVINILAGANTEALPAKHVIVLTKTHQTRDAVMSIKGVMGPTCYWVSLQNGLGNGKELTQCVAEIQIIDGVTMVPATLDAPGQVSSHGESNTWVGPLTSSCSQTAKSLVKSFNQAKINTEYADDVRVPIWQKACFNVAMNALCGLVSGSPGLLKAFPDGEQLAHEIADEALKIALLEGVAIDPSKTHSMITMACSKHTFHRPSMLQDLQANRLTEIEALNGYIQDRSEHWKTPTPLNKIILRLIRLREQSPAFWSLNGK